MNLEASLYQLENSQLIRRAGDTDLAYLFKHTLSQETAYGSLLVKKRRQVHLQVAHSVESLYADRLDEYAAVLARHYAEAGDDDKTLEYAARAGDVAARTYANAEAVASYSLALDAAKRLGVTGSSSLEKLYLHRGRSLELSGKQREALANYEEMEIAAKGKGDLSLELAAAIARATLMSIGAVTLAPEAARDLCDRALALARKLADKKSEAKILWTLSLLYNYGIHEPERAVQFGEQSLGIARQLDLREQMAYTLNDLSYGYMQAGDLKRADEVRSEAGQLWRELDNKPMLADNLHLAGMFGLLRGDLQEAVVRCEESFSINQSIGNLWGETTCQMVEGFVVDQLAQPSRAIALFERALSVGEPSGAAGPVVCARCGLGEVYRSLGAIEQGIQAIRPGLAFAESHFPGWLGWVRAELARLYLKKGDLHAAEASFAGGPPPAPAESFAIYVPPGAVTVYLAHVDLALAKRDYVHALDWLEQMISHFRKIGAWIYLPEMLYLQGEALLDQGDLVHACEILGEARTESERLNHRRSLWLILGAQARIEAEQGNSTEAQTLRERAREIVQQIAGEVNSPALREAFLGSHHVRALN